MNRLCVFLLITFNLNILVVQSAQECYSCSTTYDPSCASSPYSSSDATKKCQHSGDEIKCATYTFMLGGKNYTWRGCRTSDETCAHIAETVTLERKELVGCQICSTNLCNTGAGSENGTPSGARSFQLNYNYLLLFVFFYLLKNNVYIIY